MNNEILNKEEKLILIQKGFWDLAFEFIRANIKDISSSKFLKYYTEIFELEFFEKINEESTNILYISRKIIYYT